MATMVKPVGIQRPWSSWWLHQATPLRPHKSVKNVTCRSRSIREPGTRRVAHPAKIPAMWRTIQPAIHSSSENSSSRAMGSRFLVGGWWRKGGYGRALQGSPLAADGVQGGLYTNSWDKPRPICFRASSDLESVLGRIHRRIRFD